MRQYVIKYSRGWIQPDGNSVHTMKKLQRLVVSHSWGKITEYFFVVFTHTQEKIMANPGLYMCIKVVYIYTYIYICLINFF